MIADSSIRAIGDDVLRLKYPQPKIPFGPEHMALDDEGGTALKFAKISGHSGTDAPYLYTATQVEHDGGDDFTATHWADVSSGDDLAWNLINLAEIGTAGPAPLAVGRIVSYWAMGSKFACEINNAQGAYPS